MEAYLASLDGTRLGRVVGRDAVLEDAHRRVVVDTEEERNRVALLSGQVGSAVKGRLEDAVRPGCWLTLSMTVCGSSTRAERMSYQKAKKSPMLTTKVPGIGGQATQLPWALRTCRAGTVSWDRIVKHS